MHLNNIRRKDIDGLRAIAIFSVIIYHLKNRWLFGGFLGVDIFFILSGFLITQMLLQKDFNLSSFILNRIKRIIPALLFMLIACTVVAINIYTKAEIQQIVKPLQQSLIFIANIYYNNERIAYEIQSFFNPFLHLWSLSLEIQFYLLFSISILMLKKYLSTDSVYNICIIVFLTSLFIASLLVNKNIVFIAEYKINLKNNSTAFFLIYTRLWEFMAGALVFFISKDVQKNKKMGNFLGLLGIALLIYSLIFTRFYLSGGLFTCTVVISTVLIMLAYNFHNKNYISTFLANKVFAFFGLISYSLYLWHMPIIAFAKQIYNQPLTVNQLCSLALLSIFCAIFSYYLIEKPLKKYNLGIKNTQIQIVLWCAIFISLSYFITVLVSAKLNKLKAIDNTETIMYCNILDETSSEQILSEQCMVKYLGNNIEGLLIGDSMTHNYYYVVKNFFSTYKINHQILFTGGGRDGGPFATSFHIYMEQLNNILNNNKVKIVFIAVSFMDSKNGLQPYLLDILRELHNRNINKIVLLGQTPVVDNSMYIDKTMPLFRLKLNNYQDKIQINNYLPIENTGNININVDYTLYNIQGNFNKNAEIRRKIAEKIIASKYNLLYIEPTQYINLSNLNNLFADSLHMNPQGQKIFAKNIHSDFNNKVYKYFSNTNVHK